MDSGDSVKLHRMSGQPISENKSTQVESGQDSLPETGSKKSVSKEVISPIWNERLFTGLKVAGLGVGCVVGGAFALALLPFSITGAVILFANKEKISEDWNVKRGETATFTPAITKGLIGAITALPLCVAIASGVVIADSIKHHKTLEIVHEVYEGTSKPEVLENHVAHFTPNERAQLIGKIDGLKLGDTEKIGNLKNIIHKAMPRVAPSPQPRQQPRIETVKSEMIEYINSGNNKPERSLLEGLSLIELGKLYSDIEKVSINGPEKKEMKELIENQIIHDNPKFIKEAVPKYIDSGVEGKITMKRLIQHTSTEDLKEGLRELRLLTPESLGSQEAIKRWDEVIRLIDAETRSRPTNK